jgi:hypothetical protein
MQFVRARRTALLGSLSVAVVLLAAYPAEASRVDLLWRGERSSYRRVLQQDSRATGRCRQGEHRS